MYMYNNIHRVCVCTHKYTHTNNFQSLIKAYSSHWCLHRPCNTSKSNTKPKPLSQKINVRTDMPKMDPSLLNANLDTERDVTVVSISFENSHGNSRVTCSGQLSDKK